MSTEYAKIDIHETDAQLKQSIKKLLVEDDINEKNKKYIIDFLNDSAIGLTATINARIKEVGPRARLKNLYLLKVPGRYFKKSFDKLDIDDMKDFVRDLKSDTICKEEGDPYSEQTKANIKKTLRMLLRWLHKESPKYFGLTKWIDTRFKKKSPNALSEEEVLKMINSCHTLHQKFLVVMLFTLGCRIEEFLNIRFRDVRGVKGDVSYFVITLREEYSKTAGRDVDLTWKESNEVLREWIKLHKEKKLSDALFDSSYPGVLKTLKKTGERALGKSVAPHLLRHSAATYDAATMSHSQLCIKYGWGFSSDMPDVYIQRAGVNRKAVVEKFKSEKLEEVQERNKLLEENLKKLQSENRKEIELMKKTLEKELRQLREAMTKVPKGKRPAPELFSLLRR